MSLGEIESLEGSLGKQREASELGAPQARRLGVTETPRASKSVRLRETEREVGNECVPRRRGRPKGRHFFDNFPAIFGERVMYKLWVPPIFFKIIVPDRNYSVKYYIHHCFLKQTTTNVIDSLGDYRAAFWGESGAALQADPALRARWAPTQHPVMLLLVCSLLLLSGFRSLSVTCLPSTGLMMSTLCMLSGERAEMLGFRRDT